MYETNHPSKDEANVSNGRTVYPPRSLSIFAYNLGAEIFWELIFFLWFQLEVETFQVKDLVLCSKTCRFLTEFLGPEVFFFLCFVFIYFWWSQAHKSFGILGSQLIWALILIWIYYLGLHKTGKEPLWLINKNFRQKVTTQAAKAATNSQDATKQQLLRNRCRNKKKDQCNTEARKHQMSKK